MNHALRGSRTSFASSGDEVCGPPVTCRTVPVMKLDASEHRYRHASATSSGKPTRPRARNSPNVFSVSDEAKREAGVRVAPGSTQLTRRPRSAHSQDIVLVSE